MDFESFKRNIFSMTKELPQTRLDHLQKSIYNENPLTSSSVQSFFIDSVSIWKSCRYWTHYEAFSFVLFPPRNYCAGLFTCVLFLLTTVFALGLSLEMSPRLRKEINLKEYNNNTNSLQLPNIYCISNPVLIFLYIMAFTSYNSITQIIMWYSFNKWLKDYEINLLRLQASHLTSIWLILRSACLWNPAAKMQVHLIKKKGRQVETWLDKKAKLNHNKGVFPLCSLQLLIVLAFI